MYMLVFPGSLQLGVPNMIRKEERKCDLIDNTAMLFPILAQRIRNNRYTSVSDGLQKHSSLNVATGPLLTQTNQQSATRGKISSSDYLPATTHRLYYQPRHHTQRSSNKQRNKQRSHSMKVT